MSTFTRSAAITALALALWAAILPPIVVLFAR